MRTLTEKKEIAEAINFNQYPVIMIDLAKRDDYGIVGTKVNIDFGGDYYVHATIRTFDDEKYLKVTKGATILTNSISYEEMIKMCEYANAPVIKADQEIVVVLQNSNSGTIYNPTIIKTGKRIDRLSQNPITLEKLIVE